MSTAEQAIHTFAETTLKDAEGNTITVTRDDGKPVNLRGLDLRGVNLIGANLRGADLRGARLEGAYLRGSNLSNAILRGARLEGANLAGANLENANLICARLEGASLKGANLIDANLRGARLYGANLIGADLTGAADGPAYFSISWSGLGERGRRLHAVEQGGELLFSCGCWAGSEAQLRAYIEAGPEEFIESRIRALEIILSLSTH